MLLVMVKLFMLELMLDDQTIVGVAGLVGIVGHPSNSVTRLE